jgi:hypothetical protein
MDDGFRSSPVSILHTSGRAFQQGLISQYRDHMFDEGADAMLVEVHHRHRRHAPLQDRWGFGLRATRSIVPRRSRLPHEIAHPGNAGAHQHHLFHRLTAVDDDTAFDRLCDVSAFAAKRP